jgi:hypothetical protein
MALKVEYIAFLDGNIIVMINEQRYSYAGFNRSQAEYIKELIEKKHGYNKAIKTLEDNCTSSRKVKYVPPTDENRVARYESYKPLFTEFTLRDFQHQASDLTKKHRQIRNSKKGTENRTAKLVDFDTEKHHAVFLTEPTFSFHAQVVPEGHVERIKVDNLYKMELQFQDLDKWADADWSTMTADKFKQILDVIDVKLDCDCMSFHYQGHRFNLSQLNSAIYPTSISDPIWGPRHQGRGGLCKHLLGLVNNIFFNSPVIFSMIKNKLPKALPPQKPVPPPKPVEKLKPEVPAKPTEPVEAAAPAPAPVVTPPRINHFVPNPKVTTTTPPAPGGTTSTTGLPPGQ